MTQPLTSTERRFTASDGVELSYYTWSRAPESRCRALVLILHGIGFHASPYAVVADGVCVPDAAFAALDFRGHGSSGGVRGEMASTRRMLCDIGEWVDLMKASYPGAPVFLIAESMAGPYGTLYAAENPGKLDGLVLIAPAVLLSWRQVFHSNTLVALRKLIIDSSSPLVELGGSRLNAGSKNVAFVSMRSGDMACLQAVSSRYVLRIAEAVARLVLRPRLPVKAPVLVIHGKHDNILSPVGSRLLMLRLRSPDKRLVLMPEACHTLFWDDSSPAVFATIAAWVSQHTA